MKLTLVTYFHRKFINDINIVTPAALEEGWAFAAPGADVFWISQVVADLTNIPVSNIFILDLTDIHSSTVKAVGCFSPHFWSYPNHSEVSKIKIVFPISL